MENALAFTQKRKVRQVPCRTFTPPSRSINLFVGSRPFQMNAAIRSHCFNRRSARAEVKRDLLTEPALHSYRKINIDASVYCSGLKVSRIILRHSHDHAAIGRANVETLTVPAIAAQLNH